MRNGENRAFIPHERLVEHLARGQVEVVCRLVEQKDIALLIHHDRKFQTRLFTAGKHFNPLINRLAGKAQVPTHCAHIALISRREPIPQLGKRRFARMQVKLFLFKIGYLHIAAPTN